MPLPTKLPSNIEAEKKVLAAAMTNRVSRVEIVASCTESDFFLSVEQDDLQGDLRS